MKLLQNQKHFKGLHFSPLIFKRRKFKTNFSLMGRSFFLDINVVTVIRAGYFYKITNNELSARYCL